MDFVNFPRTVLPQTGKIKTGFTNKSIDIRVGRETRKLMEFISNINWEVIVQLTLVGLIMIAGPVVIFVLAFRGGDL